MKVGVLFFGLTKKKKISKEIETKRGEVGQAGLDAKYCINRY